MEKKEEQKKEFTRLANSLDFLNSQSSVKIFKIKTNFKNLKKQKKEILKIIENEKENIDDSIIFKMLAEFKNNYETFKKML